MAIREFTDEAGVAWRAWEIKPEEIHPQTKAEDYLADCFVVGWMVFETVRGDAKKRLCPYSMHWASATDDELREMLNRAEVVPPRKYAAEHQIVGENASRVAASGEVNAAHDVTDWDVVRTFRYPGGRLWTVCVLPAAEPGGQSVLHFTAGKRSVDMRTWPKDWADAPDENLVELLRSAAPRSPDAPQDPDDRALTAPTPKRRATTDGRLAPPPRRAMPVLEFDDSKGVRWRVWSTIPRESAMLPTEHQGGWLTFDSGAGRRRLAPLPAGWEEASAARLELMCRAATEVTHLTGELARAERPADWPDGKS